jgi:hypothetical protein
LALVVLVLLGGAVVWTVLSGPTPEAPPSQESTEQPSPSRWFTPGQPGFAPIPIHTRELRAAMDALPQVQGLPQAQLAPWSQALEALHLAELRQDREAVAKHQEQAQLQAREFYGAHQVEGVRAALGLLYPRFRQSLRHLHQAAQANGQTLDELWRAHGQEHQEHFARVGSFLQVGAQLGLIDATGGVDEANELMVEVFYRYRLASMLQKMIQPEAILSLEELRLLYLWRLHQIRGLELGRRMRYIQKIAQVVPGYPTSIAQAVVYYQANRMEDARVALERAQKQQTSTRPLVADYLAHINELTAPPTDLKKEP